MMQTTTVEMRGTDAVIIWEVETTCPQDYSKVDSWVESTKVSIIRSMDKANVGYIYIYIYIHRQKQ